MALAATKLVLEAGVYFRYEQGPSGIPEDDGWWTVETGYYYYFDNDHKVPKTSLKERKNQKFRLVPLIGSKFVLKSCHGFFLPDLKVTLGKLFSNEEK